MTQATAGNLAAETSGHRAVCLPSQTAQDSQRPEMQKKRRGDSLDHDRLSYSRSQVGPCQAATPCPGTLLQTLGKQLTRPIIQRHSLYSTLVPWSFGAGATPTTYPRETPQRAPGHRVGHIPYQSSSPRHPPMSPSLPGRRKPGISAAISAFTGCHR